MITHVRVGNVTCNDQLCELFAVVEHDTATHHTVGYHLIAPNGTTVKQVPDDVLDTCEALLEAAAAKIEELSNDNA